VPFGLTTLCGCSHAKEPAGSTRANAPRSAYDLYTPRFTKGIGHDKVGLCPICFESAERGGADRAEWLAMKTSAYSGNVHLFRIRVERI